MTNIIPPEFVVLNQLMAVAARGMRRETFGEKRYHRDSVEDSSYWGRNIQQMSDFVDHPKESRDSLQKPHHNSSEQPSKGETEITVPAPVLEEVRSRSKSGQYDSEDSFLPLQGKRVDASGTTKNGGGGADSKARAIAKRLRPGTYFGDGAGNGAKSVNAKTRRTDDDEDDDDEIPLHMWERNGEVIMRIPWFENQRGKV